MSEYRPSLPRLVACTVEGREGWGVKRDDMLAWFCNEELAKEWLRYRYSTVLGWIGDRSLTRTDDTGGEG